MQSRVEDILMAIINGTSSSELPPPQSRNEALLLRILDKINEGGSLPIHICTSDEYDHSTGVPTISSPDEGTLYLVPASSATTGNLFDEWVYVNSAWEKVGSVNVDVPVQDVQVAGTSVVQDGVANVPIAADSAPGVVSVSSNFGITIQDDVLKINGAVTSESKAGANTVKPIVPSHQHESAFYGLAKAAGSDEKDSILPVGQYTDAAKSAISQMLNGSVAVTGTTPAITALPGIRYVCGEVSTITITPPASGIVNIVFESGTTPTVLTLPQTVVMPEWFDSTDLEANRVYEISIADGVHGVVTSWPA